MSHEWERIKQIGGLGILKRQDISDLTSQRAKVLWLMLDGLWHPANDIIRAARGREGLRRMRELREIPYVDIERKRMFGKRDFMYRLVYKPGLQRELFNG